MTSICFTIQHEVAERLGQGGKERERARENGEEEEEERRRKQRMKSVGRHNTHGGGGGGRGRGAGLLRANRLVSTALFTMVNHVTNFTRSSIIP